MKWLVAVAVVGVGLGAWAGFRADGSTAVETWFQTGLAVFLTCNLLFGYWVWSRAKPGSGDRMVMPTVMLMSAGMLVGILPRLFWPAAERLHIAGSIASLAVLVGTVIVQYRRRRALAQGRGR